MKLIMVDLDGTLIDTKEVNYYAYKEVLESYGYSMDYKYFCDYCNGRHYMDFLPQITTSDENILTEIHERKKSLYSKYLDKAVINRSLIDIVEKCKSEYKIALVTTASKKNTNEILNYYQMKDNFDLILTRDDITKSKPDPEGFFRAMSYFDSDPDECIIFEDSAVGIEAAEKTGAAVFVVRGFN